MADDQERDDFGPAEQQCAKRLIALALAEDLGDVGDITAKATIPDSAQGGALFVARASGVVCGRPIVDLLAERFALDLHWNPIPDPVPAGALLGVVAGPMREILAFERTALNFLQRLSGVATLTARFVTAVRGTRAQILDTRKTTPGWRVLEKYAVRRGGGRNHRMGLHDAVLIKDNHLAWLADESSGVDPIQRALAAARSANPTGTQIEIEVDSLDQFDRALQGRPDIILLDNFPLDRLAEAVRRRDDRGSGVLLEASGGVRLETVRAIAESGVERISVGALTHSAVALDIALDLEPATQRP